MSLVHKVPCYDMFEAFEFLKSSFTDAGFDIREPYLQGFVAISTPETDSDYDIRSILLIRIDYIPDNSRNYESIDIAMQTGGLRVWLGSISKAALDADNIREHWSFDVNWETIGSSNFFFSDCSRMFSPDTQADTVLNNPYEVVFKSNNVGVTIYLGEIHYKRQSGEITQNVSFLSIQKPNNFGVTSTEAQPWVALVKSGDRFRYLPITSIDQEILNLDRPADAVSDSESFVFPQDGIAHFSAPSIHSGPQLSIRRSAQVQINGVLYSGRLDDTLLTRADNCGHHQEIILGSRIYLTLGILGPHKSSNRLLLHSGDI